MKKLCLHCGEEIKNDLEEFCCLGCSAAYKIIGKFGFENYYKIREINSEVRKIKPEEQEKIDIDEFILEKDGVFEVNLAVQGLHCAACVWLIEGILKKQKNVLLARINLSKKTLFLKWKNDQALGNYLVSLISDIGYKLLPFDLEILQKEEKKYDDSILKALAVAGFGVGNIMLFSFSLWFFDAKNMGVETRNLLHFFSSLIALPVIAYSARPFFSSAFKSIKAGFPNMDLAISIAIFLACVVSTLEAFRSAAHVYFDSAVMLIFFLLIGRYLDLKARKKAFAIAAEFNLLNAGFGRVENGDKVKILPIKDLKEEMILLVAMGEKIAADGVVMLGESEIDMSLINGEVMPKKIMVGSEVFAGTINLAAPIKVRITKSSSNSLLAQIIALTEDIENKKNHYVRIADQLAKFYLPAVHALAFATFLFWFKNGWEVALMNATAVLIITCPCALALAVPIVQTIVISNLIKKGILVKSGEALEKIHEIPIIVFDKTGSVTLGKPRLKRIVGVLENEKEKFLKIAASIAKHSKHPLSLAISKAYQGDLENFSVKEIQGQGLEAFVEASVARLGKKDFCKISSEKIFTTEEGELFCFMKIAEKEIMLVFEDEIKLDAGSVIEALKAMKKRIILLSGDVEKNVKLIAEKLGINEFYFEKTPIEKVKFLEKLKNEGQKFIMVGDGLNDAPALALADVSISFLQAVDLSQNIADIVMQQEKLSSIIDLINFSKKSIKLMKQNLLIALVYNLIAVPFAVMGHVVPLIAAIAMSSSSILVLLNSLRVR